MPPNVKHYSREYECEGVQMITYVSQGSVATDLRGGSRFNFVFLQKYENRSTVVEVIAKRTVVQFLRHGECK